LKTDLDRLMAERKYDAVLVLGPAAHNAPMYYLAGGVAVGKDTVLIQKRGRAPVLFVNAMERDEAARSGLRVVTKFRYRQILREAGGDTAQALVRYFGQMLAEAGVGAGTVAVFGQQDAGAAYRLLDTLNRADLGVRLVGDPGLTILERAAATKDLDEVRRIRSVGRRTLAVVADVQEFLTSHRARDGYLVGKDGARLTLGDVKRRINLKLAEAGLVDAEGGTIFAIGRDAGVPHSRGNPRHPLALGKTIVFDIFPAEPGGGYFFDFTRTWCLGHAPDHVLEAYEAVRAAHAQALRTLKPGAPCRDYQRATCALFEARGHATIQTDPATTSGYVHSLGHGLGLRIHEAPSLADTEGNTGVLEPGAVFTVEPGLYYPDHPRGGFGVRIEDTVWLDPRTLRFEVLAKYPVDLILPVKPAGRRR